MNKILVKMGNFIWLDNSKHILNIIKMEDVKDMVTKKKSNGYSDNNFFERIHMLTLSINVFKQPSFFVSTLKTHVKKHTW